MSSVRPFHASTTLLENAHFLQSNLQPGLNSFKQCPLVLDLERSKNIPGSIGLSSKPLKILNTSIRSPRNLLVSSVVKFSLFNLTSYGLSLNDGIIFVARL